MHLNFSGRIVPSFCSRYTSTSRDVKCFYCNCSSCQRDVEYLCDSCPSYQHLFNARLVPTNVTSNVPSVHLYRWVTLRSIFAYLLLSIRRVLVALVHNALVHMLYAGSIPASLGKLLVLKALNLSANKLSGGRRGQYTAFLTFLIFCRPPWFKINHIGRSVKLLRSDKDITRHSFEKSVCLCESVCFTVTESDLRQGDRRCRYEEGDKLMSGKI